MIFVLDNYDSFTYNLVHMLYAAGRDIRVRRNRDVRAEEVLALSPEAILLSPGPGRPEDAGCMMELIRLAAGRIPLLGVCLGHQALGAVFGAEVVHAKRIMHGKISEIEHDGEGLFSGLPQKFKAVRYHSLALRESSLPETLKISARSEDGEIMGIRVNGLARPAEGIQYHPESMMTEYGKEQIAGFLKNAGVLS